MRHDELIRRIRKAARTNGLTLEQVATSGRGKHEKWTCGGIQVIVPRGTINDRTAEAIMKHLEQALGKGWWRP